MAQSESLHNLHQNPLQLIPERLLQLIGDPEIIKAASLETVLGGQRICQDNEYLADLSFIVFKEEGLKDTEEQNGDGWDRVLENQRQRAIKDGLMTNRDRPLIYFVACEFNPGGAQISGYIEASCLRRKGIGQSFYRKFDLTLQKMGYSFVWGNHDQENLSFFQKLDRYTLDQLRPGSLSNHDILIMPGGSGSIPAIRFLDKQLEEECVKPEFLKFQ